MARILSLNNGVPTVITPNTVSAGAIDAAKTVQLNANGLLDSSLLPIANNGNMASTSAIMTASQTVTNISGATQVDVGFNSTLGTANIPFNTATGVVSLTAGVKYQITVILKANGFTAVGGGPSVASYLAFQVVDSVTNVSINSNIAVVLPLNNAAPDAANNVHNIIYTPTVNQGIKVRLTNGLGNCVLPGNENFFNVVALQGAVVPDTATVLIRDAPLITPWSYISSVGSVGATLAASVSTNSNILLLPWTSKRTGNIDAMGIEVTTLGAATTFRLAVYRNSAGLPLLSPIWASGAMDSGSVGNKVSTPVAGTPATAVLSLLNPAGFTVVESELLWIGLWTSSTATVVFRSDTNSSTVNLSTNSTTMPPTNSYPQRSYLVAGTYSPTANPPNIATPTLVGTNSIPRVFVRYSS
jgi:hypothetical protein